MPKHHRDSQRDRVACGCSGHVARSLHQTTSATAVGTRKTTKKTGASSATVYPAFCTPRNMLMAAARKPERKKRERADQRATGEATHQHARSEQEQPDSDDDRREASA